jgi:hypothetical protein
MAVYIFISIAGYADALAVPDHNAGYDYKAQNAARYFIIG